MLAIVCSSVCPCAVCLQFEYTQVYCRQPAVMSVFLLFWQPVIVLCYVAIFVLLVLIAHWQINMMMMTHIDEQPMQQYGRKKCTFPVHILSDVNHVCEIFTKLTSLTTLHCIHCKMSRRV